jgi:hypothetical protein
MLGYVLLIVSVVIVGVALFVGRYYLTRSY